jgi:hypothetical protein
MLSSSINKISDMDKEIRGSNIKLDDLPKDKTAIVVVDMVNGFVQEGLLSSPRILTVIDSIKGLLSSADGCKKIFFLDRHSETSPELKTYFNEKNLDRRIIVPIDGVETYDYGTHDGDLMKVISLWERKLNGIEIADSIT